MIKVIIGLIIIIFGVYYIPENEAKNNITKMFYFVMWIWIAALLIFAPMILSIILDGLEKTHFYTGEVKDTFLSIGSLIIYFIIYKSYTTRLELCKFRYESIYEEK